MATTSGRQPILAAVPPPPPTLTTPFATILSPNKHPTKPHEQEITSSILKKPDIINGRYTISWHSKEIQQSVIATGLEYAIMGKFKYGNPDIHELRKIIPAQCGIKGEVNIGVLEPRLTLIRCTLKEDYINLLSSSGFWLTLKNEYVHMRTLKWDTWYDSKKETAISVAWISFPNIPPNFFARDFVYSLAMAVGKPLTVDMATRNNTRPSCARVKVEVNLLKDLPHEIVVGEHDDTKKIMQSKTVKIRYDCLPKYCKTCYLQGHDEEGCYTLHPELYQTKHVHDKGQIPNRQVEKTIVTSTEGKMEGVIDHKQKGPTHIVGENNSLFKSGRLVYTEQQRNEWQQGRMKRKNTGPTNREIVTGTNHGQSNVFQSTNSFQVLHDQEEIEEGELNNGSAAVINEATVQTHNVDDVEEREEGGLLDEILKARAHHLQQERDKSAKIQNIHACAQMDMRDDGREKNVMEKGIIDSLSFDGKEARNKEMEPGVGDE